MFRCLSPSNLDLWLFCHVLLGTQSRRWVHTWSYTCRRFLVSVWHESFWHGEGSYITQRKYFFLTIGNSLTSDMSGELITRAVSEQRNSQPCTSIQQPWCSGCSWCSWTANFRFPSRISCNYGRIPEFRMPGYELCIGTSQLDCLGGKLSRDFTAGRCSEQEFIKDVSCA